MDSNNDGIGDILGIISKLEYLSNLGVDYIWLSPVFKSPGIDNGYDISDYYSINEMFGTLSDIKKLISKAKTYNIKIIMDLVVNHTSTENEWFIKSKDINSKYHNYYIWENGKNNNTQAPNNWQSAFGGPAWEFDKEVNKWYLHLFAKEQADLNWKNEDVYQEVKKILEFWLDLGVKGFRCDVINQIYKTTLDDGKKQPFQTGFEHYGNQKGMHDILKRLNSEVFEKYDALMIGETDRVTIFNGQEFLKNELDMFFSFEHVVINMAKIPVFRKRYNPNKLISILSNWQNNISWNTIYFENHDRHRSINQFGNTKKYYKESSKALSTLLLTLKGTPFIYQGEEIGMTDSKPFKIDEIDDIAAKTVNSIVKKIPVLNLPFIRKKLVNNVNRDHERTPMQWNSDINAGFSKAKNTWLKVNPNYLKINVNNELNDSNSIYNYYKKLIGIRKNSAALSHGDINIIKSTKGLFVYRRTSEKDSYLIIVNMEKKKHKFVFDSSKIIINNYTYIDKNTLHPYQAIVLKG
jgi:oligo-1,6-glucosidase